MSPSPRNPWHHLRLTAAGELALLTAVVGVGVTSIMSLTEVLDLSITTPTFCVSGLGPASESEDGLDDICTHASDRLVDVFEGERGDDAVRGETALRVPVKTGT